MLSQGKKRLAVAGFVVVLAGGLVGLLRLADSRIEHETTTLQVTQPARPSHVDKSSNIRPGYTLSCSPKPHTTAGIYSNPELGSKYISHDLAVSDNYSAIIAFIDTSGGTYQFIGGELRNGRGVKIARDSVGLQDHHPVIGNGWFFLSSEWNCTLYSSS